MCELDLVMPYGVMVLPPRARYRDKTPCARHEKPLSELLVRELEESPQTIQGIVIILTCLPEDESKRTHRLWTQVLGGLTWNCTGSLSEN